MAKTLSGSQISTLKVISALPSVKQTLQQKMGTRMHVLRGDNLLRIRAKSTTLRRKRIAENGNLEGVKYVALEHPPLRPASPAVCRKKPVHLQKVMLVMG